MLHLQFYDFNGFAHSESEQKTTLSLKMSLSIEMTSHNNRNIKTNTYSRLDQCAMLIGCALHADGLIILLLICAHTVNFLNCYN